MSNTEIATAANPFAAKAPAVVEGAASNSDEARAVQEVQAALVIAKKFPRDPVDAMDRILNACTRPTLAAGALYTYSRGGSDISGPSIRLAEAVAQEWGNMQFGIRELSSANGVSTVEAFAWDVQTNTKQVKTFQVEHVRYTRNAGKKKLTDPRDVYEVIANQGARRLRACILGVIPGDVIEAAVDQCAKTQAAHVDTSPEAIKKLREAFDREYGVTQEMIETRIGRRLEAITPGQFISLRNVFASLRDGMSTPADWFEGAAAVEKPAGPATSDLKLAPAAPAAEQASEPPPAKPVTARTLVNRFKRAESVDELASMIQADDVAHLGGPDADPAERDKVSAAYRACVEALTEGVKQAPTVE